jgi:hypothetical protein
VEQAKKETKFQLDIVFYPIWIQELIEEQEDIRIHASIVIPHQQEKETDQKNPIELIILYIDGNQREKWTGQNNIELGGKQK